MSSLHIKELFLTWALGTCVSHRLYVCFYVFFFLGGGFLIVCVSVGLCVCLLICFYVGLPFCRCFIDLFSFRRKQLPHRESLLKILPGCDKQEGILMTIMIKLLRIMKKNEKKKDNR